MKHGKPNIFDLIRNPDEYFPRTKCPGLWRGRVEDVSDPERRGRIRARVSGLYPDEIPTAHLPWAEGCFADGGGQNYGDFFVPYNVGDMVWIIFEQEDSNYPVWLGTGYSSPGTSSSEIPSECQSGYPKKRIFKTRNGHKILLSDVSGAEGIFIEDKKGNKIGVDMSRNKINIVSKGTMDVTVQGNVNVKANGTITVRAPLIKHN